MRAFRTLLLWLLLALAGALAWQLLASDPGEVFIRFRGVDIATDVPRALVMVGLGLLIAWLLVQALALPLRAWRMHRRRRLRRSFGEGLQALHEGRWARAGKLLADCARRAPAWRTPALLGAAQAARARGEASVAQAHLAAADPVAASLAVAPSLLERGDALAAVERLSAHAELPPRGVGLLVEALLAAGRPVEAWRQMPALRASRYLCADLQAAQEARVAAAALAQAPDSEALDTLWRDAGKALRRQPSVIAGYARRAAALGLEDLGAEAIEKCLDTRWDESLAALYGRLPRGRRGSRLGRAEGWLPAHPASPALLLCLGCLCRQEGLLGKAEDYLHRAIAQGGGAEAWEELGHCFVAEGNEPQARMSFANALRLARAEVAQELPGRGIRERIQDQAVREERDEHGMPRLPQV